MADAVTRNDEFAKLWVSALELYQKRTGRDLESDPNVRSIKSLEDLRKKIDQSNQSFNDFRKHHERLWKVVSSVCMPIQVVGGLARDVIAASQVVPACAAFGAIFHLVTAAKGVSEAYDDVEELLSRISTSTERFQQYSQGDMVESLGMLVTKTMCKILEILGRAEKLAKRPRAQEYLRIAVLGKDEKLKYLLNELNLLSTEEAALVLALVNSSTQRIEKGIEKLNVQLGHSDSKKESTADRNHMASLLDEGMSNCMYEIYRSIERDRVESTGEWIFHDEVMQRWLDRNSSFLWILGVGGIGKSFLSYSIINELEKRKRLSQCVAYYFIKSDSTDTGSVNNLLKCVALQIASQNNEYRQFATGVCKDERQLRVSEDTWKHLFDNYFSVNRFHGSASVVIDGVDEAPAKEQKILFRIMQELCRWKSGLSCRLQFLLLGRPDITAQWPDASPVYIEVSPSKMSGDVARYVEQNIKRVRTLKCRNISSEERKALKQLILERLQKGAAGMFLWARLLLDEIMDQPRPSDVKRILKSPPSIFQLLQTIIERLIKDPSGSGEDLREILLWTCFTQRELYLGEIKFVLELRGEIGEGLPDLEYYLREKYRSLFVLDRRDGKSTEELRRTNLPDSVCDRYHDSNPSMSKESDSSLNEEDGEECLFESDWWTTKVRISHSIIRDFISQGYSKNSVAINIDPNEAHTYIATMCLRCLSGRLPTTKGGQPLRDQAHFHEYSVSNFLFHTLHLNPQSMSQAHIETVSSLISYNLFNRESLERIIRLRDGSDKFLATFLSYEVLSKIQQWITLAPLNDAGPAELEWRASSRSSKKSLLKPMADTVAAFWLQDLRSKEEQHRKYLNFYIAFLRGYQGLLDSSQRAQKLAPDDIIDAISIYDINRLHHKAIYRIAVRTDLPQDSRWYSNLGLALCWNNLDHEAVYFFEKSLELEKENPVAFHGLCNASYGLGDYAQSIKMGVACLSLEPNEKSSKLETWYSMELAARSLPSEDYSVLDRARERLKSHARSAEGISFYIITLFLQDCFVEIVTYLEQLLGPPDSGLADNTLYQLLPQLSLRFTWVAMAVVLADRKLQGLSIAEILAEAAESACDVERKQISKFFAGLISFIDQPDSAAPAEAFESIRYELDCNGNCRRDIDIFDEIDGYLASYYFEEAMGARDSGKHTPAVWIEKLESLFRKPTFAPTRLLHGPVEPKPNSSVVSNLAVWYRLEGNVELSAKLLRPRIQAGVQILRDKDIQTSSKGYYTLASVLLRAGNIEQAIAALTPLLSPFSRQQARTKSSQSLPLAVQTDRESLKQDQMFQATSGGDDPGEKLPHPSPMQHNDQQTEINSQTDFEDPSFDLEKSGFERSSSTGVPPIARIDDNQNSIRCEMIYTCGVIEELWVCEYCENLFFLCGHCLGRFQARTKGLIGSPCRPYHPYHQVYPIQEAMKERATIKVEGRTLPRQEWLRELELSWMLSKPESHQ